MAFRYARETADLWGRYVESCAGAHLKSQENRGHCKLYYWREGSLEADFVLSWKSKAEDGC